ncbi:MAG: preprotein translocase subunit YajC [Nitrospinae bacterium RIFCSPLOWO2_12_FULL_47_7]|nr:MAG: preprotein translocase subunit YajC [Nitrospinae bacterium RIFCSPLOWO2_12_FULL_47_7]
MLSLAFAVAPEGTPPGGGSLLSLLPPMIMMFLIFYFILIRPQQKKQQEQQKMVDSLKDGDNVVTLSGIHGTIRKVKDDFVMLQIADNVRIKINRSSIGVQKKDDGSVKE